MAHFLSRYLFCTDAETAQVLGHQQVDIDADAPGQGGEGDQRPRPGPLEVDKPARQRASHPLRQVRVFGEKTTSRS